MAEGGSSRPHVLVEAELTAGPEDPPELHQCCFLVGHRAEHPGDGDGIDGPLSSGRSAAVPSTTIVWSESERAVRSACPRR